MDREKARQIIEALTPEQQRVLYALLRTRAAENGKIVEVACMPDAPNVRWIETEDHVYINISCSEKRME